MSELFQPTHLDSKILAAAPAAVSVSPPAVTPTKPVTAVSEGCTHPSEPSSQPPEVKESEVSKMLARIGASTSLDPLESSVKELDESSLCSCFRHSGWSQIRSKVFASLVRTGQTPTRIHAFGQCGSDAWLCRSNITEKDARGVPAYKFCIKSNCCHDRLCTPCANTRSATIRDKLLQLMHGKQVSIITLTLSGKDQGLQEKVDRLYKHFRSLRLHPLWDENVAGGAAFLEIKYSEKAKRWHPHLHIIAEAKFIDQGELSTVWHTITKDSFIVDVGRPRDEKMTGVYVAKYASKPLNSSFSNDPNLLDEAVMALKGRRLCLTFGTWYGTPLTYAEDEALADDLTDAAGYTTYLHMNQLIRDVRAGDSEAIHISRCLNIFDRLVRSGLDPPSSSRRP